MRAGVQLNTVKITLVSQAAWSGTRFWMQHTVVLSAKWGSIAGLQLGAAKIAKKLQAMRSACRFMKASYSRRDAAMVRSSLERGPCLSSLFYSSGGLGKIKLKLTTLPRNSIHAACQFKSISTF